MWVCLVLCVKEGRRGWPLPARAGARAGRGGAHRSTARAAWGSKLNIVMEGVANLSTPRGRQSGREDEGRGVVVQLWLGLD